MSKILLFCFLFVLCFSLLTCSLAVDSSELDLSEEFDSISSLYPDLYTYNIYYDSPPSDSISDEWDLISVDVYSVETPVTSSSGLKGALLSILGEYDPPVVVYQYQNSSSGSYSYLREVVPDYPWIGSCLCLLLLLYGIIRFGGVLCRR